MTIEKILSLEERKALIEEEINGERLKEEMIRKAEDYARDYRNYLMDSQITDALKVGKDTDGGYLVPDEMEESIVEGIKEANVIRKVATTLSTKGKHLINGVNDKPAALWVDEGGQLTFGEACFNQVYLTAHKNGCILQVSEELIEDSAFDIEEYIARVAGEAIGELEEEAFINGNSENKPRGFLLDAEVGIETAEITGDIIRDLFSSLRAPYRQKAVWIMNEAAEAAVRKIKTADGRPIWEQGMDKEMSDMLLGRPVYTAKAMPEPVAGNCPIAFGDFSYYWIGDRGKRSVKRLNELYADRGLIGFRVTHRVDGRLVLPEAVKTLKISA
ncbi:MAG: phage major capsid protein [Lachnospiraceae bacterium]|nr:phage major capsid protein [Lachnospiraceae bacterium]